MEIESEDIFDHEEEKFHITPQNNCIAVQTDDMMIDDPSILINDESKIYTCLNTVGIEKSVRTFGRLTSTPLIKSTCFNRENNYYRTIIKPSPKKLGISDIGRTDYGKLMTPRKLKENNLNEVNEIIDIVKKDDEEITNIDDIKHEECLIFDANIPKLSPDDENKNDESLEDMFAESQKSIDNHSIINNKNCENNIQHITPVKVIKQDFDNCIIDDDKLFLSPQSFGRSMSYDSDFERACNSITNNKFDPGQFTFEAIELLDDFDDINDLIDTNILSELLESSVINKPMTDPLADSPVKTNDFDELNNSSLSDNQDDKENEIKTDRRRSMRLQIKSNEKKEIRKRKEFRKKNNSSPETIKFKKLEQKIKLIDKKKVISSEIIEKLKNLEIKLQHEPPPQHRLETHIGMPPSRDVNKEFNEYCPLKRGIYSEADDEIILNNWKCFCESHNWDPEQYDPLFRVGIRRKSIMSVNERIKFGQFLANGLPNRSLNAVFRRFRMLCTEYRCSHYTKAEDEQILLYMNKKANHPENTQKLGQLLGRTRMSIRKRYNTLQKLNKERKVKTNVEWDIPLIENFLKYLLKVTLSNDISELKNAIIPIVVWKKIGKKLDIPCETAKLFWLMQLHTQLFYTRPIHENDLKIMLIEYMYVKGIASKREIVWSNITNCFDGLTTYYVCRLFWSLVYSGPIKRLKNLAEMIGWLYKVKIPKLKKKLRDRCLPRLIYKKGKIKIVDDYSSPSPCNSESDT